MVVLPITTARLRLRMPRLDDAQAVEAMVCERAVAETTAAIPHPYPPGGAGPFLARVLAWWADGRTYHFAVERREDEALIGMIELRPGIDGRPADLGYYVGRPYWGHGYATEAVGRVVALGFEAFNVARFETCVFAGNVASARVLSKIGFKKTGEAERDYPVRGRRIRVWLYARDRPVPPRPG
ncbi:MAG TPA: GNAT family N-acetyltransferase [Alphaproteobacteria bacterium]